jgi:2-oxoisovalerate dehydrogenase E1 component
VSDLSLRAAAYGMDGYIVDGNDPIAIYQLVKSIKENIHHCYPCIIEAKTYRHYDHIGDQLGSVVGYRSREEEEAWLYKDAITSFPNSLIEAGILTETAISRVTELAKTSVARAINFCLTPGCPRTIRPELWPRSETVLQGLRSYGDEWHGIEFKERQHFSEFKTILYREAVAAAITHWLQRDRNAIFIGEEVGSPGSILHSADPKLPSKYASQIFNTPISEAGFIGLSCGAAMLNMRVVAELMYSNFSLVAADQLFSQIAKSRYLYGNTVNLPIVVRTKVALGFGMGEHHSMNPVGLFALFPGWRIVVPANAFDYIGLFNSAMQSLDPVLIVESKSLYDQEFQVPNAEFDYFVSLGKAQIVNDGQDITIITYGSMVGRCQKLCRLLADEGISAEVVDLRTVDLLGIDYDTIEASVRKTGKVVIVEEAAASQGICKTIAANITERLFDCLQRPITCITGKDVNPVSRVLEIMTTVQDRDIVETVTLMMKKNLLTSCSELHQLSSSI